MKFSKTSRLFVAFVLILFVSAGWAENVKFGAQTNNGRKLLWLSNNQIKFSLFFEKGRLAYEKLEAEKKWLSKFGTNTVVVQTDADFALDIMWSGWHAPEKVSNAENPVVLTKEAFRLEHYDVRRLENTKELNLFLKGINNSFDLQLTYQLEEKAFYVRRKLAIRDSRSQGHFLRWIWPYRSTIFQDISLIKSGGFGRPLAFMTGDGGAFFGLEYPASENSIILRDGEKNSIRCGQEIGERIRSSSIESEWVVEGLSPNLHIKLWFLKYLDRIRVMPLKPYLLYNTWYDVRAPEIVKTPEHVMNEKNLLRIIKCFRKEMFEKRGINLDAFVLDDGWDIYRSDWMLNEEQFPHGLAPIRKALEKMGTSLGLWFGPTGGYSNRKLRIGWMREHDYEVIKDQLCIAGKNYRNLFKKRVVDFVHDDGVGYYKWDGIQFSCSEPDHGHPVGIYSRRSVMESVIDLCRSVRSENPDIFLNITSGTWLSPWWLKYANAIWMQGSDYGYSDIPSISRRDRAITYRDFVLFDDFKRNDFWFPIANLMTHGIIKGHLQKLGGESEPLNKFTDNALLYLARGVSMWELYISPNILSDGEWNALEKSIKWAKDRFEILKSTEMVGGNPKKREAYGYAHFKGKHGVIAARNPFIESRVLEVPLAISQGLSSNASSLVAERVYPMRWISPRLYKAGESLKIPLQGYETAIFEIYPLEGSEVPLLSGVSYEVIKEAKNNYAIRYFDVGEDARILNPEKIAKVNYKNKALDPREVTLLPRRFRKTVSNMSVKPYPEKYQTGIDIQFKIHNNVREATLAILLESEGRSKEENDPQVAVFLDGKREDTEIERQKGKWGWYMVNVSPGKHDSRVRISSASDNQKWDGKASIWLVCSQEIKGTEISFDLVNPMISRRAEPPSPWPLGRIRNTVKLGNVNIKIDSRSDNK